MTRIAQHQVSMTRGEVTPLVHARVDLDDYRLGLTQCQNFLPLKYGGVTRIPGTVDLAACADSTKVSRLIPFVFSQTQAYALEFAHEVIRIFTPDGVITDGSPVEVVSPYQTSELWDIHVEAIGDVVYITCDGHAVRTLTRTSNTSWTLALYEYTRGPFLIMPPAGSAVAVLTDSPTDVLTTAAGTESIDGGSFSTGRVFGRDNTTFTRDSSYSGVVSVTWEAGVGESTTLAGYALWAMDDPRYQGDTPVSWKLEASNDATTWVVLDSVQMDSGWLAGETRIREIANVTAYRYYKWTFDSGGSVSSDMVLPLIEALISPEEQTSYTVTFSSTTGVNDDAGFTSDDVGRLIYALADNGYWYTLRIESVTSTTVIECVTVAPSPVPANTTAFSQWRLQAWGTTPGAPKRVVRHAGRLGFFNTDADPRGGWLSVSSGYDDFRVSQPLLDDDAISFTLQNGRQDEILWAASNGSDLLLGTVGGIRVITKRDTAAVLSPSNIEEQGATFARAGDVDPLWVSNMLLFVEKHGKTVMESAFSTDEGGYVTRELTMLAEHVFRGAVKELHLQQHPGPTLYAVLEDGRVAACAYDRQQQVFGVGVISIPGTSAEVVSMAVIPGDGYDVPLLVTKRTVDGTPQHRVERMADQWREDGKSAETVPIYLMTAGIYDSTETTTISGLGHLEGETVAVFDTALRKDLGDATVSSGAIAVPGGASVTEAVVGLRYTSLIETLRPPNVPEDGGYMGRPSNIVEVHADLYETYGVYGGTETHLEQLRSESDFANTPATPALHTGKLRVPVDDGWEEDQTIVLQTDRAYSATVRALMVTLDRGS